MATLHVLSHSPFGDGRFASCLRLLGEGDALLLCGDAVYALQPASTPYASLERLGASTPVYVLAEDHAARGGGAPGAGVTLVDYAAFVELCCRYERVNSWL